MSEQDHDHGPTIRGTIRRRLLVNAAVDPDEASSHLPDGLRAHVTELGTVVGVCLLEIDAIRPAGLPAVVGRRLRAVAHRISVEWDDDSGRPVTGVYVPVRHTDSRLAVGIGGRWFPGVHERARVDVTAFENGLRWRSEPLDAAGLGVRVEVSYRGDVQAAAVSETVGTTCLGASIGVSPDRHGRLEAAHMEASHRRAREVMVEDLESEFLKGFRTAEPTASYLMCDAEVTWTRATARVQA
jgi:hypothetical protein